MIGTKCPVIFTSDLWVHFSLCTIDPPLFFGFAPAYVERGQTTGRTLGCACLEESGLCIRGKHSLAPGIPERVERNQRTSERDRKRASFNHYNSLPGLCVWSQALLRQCLQSGKLLLTPGRPGCDLMSSRPIQSSLRMIDRPIQNLN